MTEPNPNLNILLKGLDPKFEPKEEAVQVTINSLNINLEEYIKLPEHNLYISKTKILHNLDWQDTWTELEKQNQNMLTIKQFTDFIELLRKGVYVKKEVYDAKGNKIELDELKQIYNEITEARDPWRAEWLDAYFEEKPAILPDQGGLYLLTKNKRKEEKLLEDYVKEDYYADLSFNKQGLPIKTSIKQRYGQGKNVYYWAPVSGRVARFSAGSDWASLICCFRDTSNSYSGLGVRPSFVEKKI